MSHPSPNSVDSADEVDLTEPVGPPPDPSPARTKVPASPALPLTIVDPVPLYRRGLSDALAQAGFVPQEPLDVDAWAELGGTRIVLVTVNLIEDIEIVRRLSKSRNHLVVVGLLREPTVQMYVAAIRAGASGAVSWMASPETVVQTVEAACTQCWMLPIAIAKAMTAQFGIPPEAVGASPSEVEWLKLLASGATVSQLARDVGYSERKMFRLLHHLYLRMGVRTRTEALIKATDLRLLQ